MSCRNITSHNSDPLRGVQRADFLFAVNPDVVSLKIHGFTSDKNYLTFFSETLSGIFYDALSHILLVLCLTFYGSEMLQIACKWEAVTAAK